MQRVVELAAALKNLALRTLSLKKSGRELFTGFSFHIFEYFRSAQRRASLTRHSLLHARHL